MLNFFGQTRRTCDGVTRRDMLRVGSLAIGGLSLPGLLRSRAAAAAAGQAQKKTSVILIWQAGGPSHIDMYDLKPAAPAEIRGEFNEISTKVPGILIGEHLPRQAEIMDRLAVVRSVTHTNAGHGMGSHWMMTGYEPRTEVHDNLFPSVGSVASKMRGPNHPDLPAFVSLPRRTPYSSAAYLGASYNPFSPDADPNNDGFKVRNLQLAGRISQQRLDRRQLLLHDLDHVRRDLDTAGTMGSLDKFYVQAMQMVTSDHARRAFDIQLEDAPTRDMYGRHDLGQSCLLARRLVEAGVTFVTIQAGGGWDTHGNNFSELKKNLLPKFDQAVTGLVTDLHQRGLQNDVLLMCMGEFGRTPRINPGAGRDHWPGAMSVLFAGGGMKTGQMIGTTNAHAEYPTSRPTTPGDVLSTMYQFLGIDYHHEFYGDGARPLAILREGTPIRELLG